MGKGGRIYDSVHGYIDLDESEFDVVTSPTFQRLHWIKQLGLLHIVFPSAQHSRFSHSLGVFHIVKKMIEHLKKPGKVGLLHEIGKDEEKTLCFAALLHDIGHVPLSHVGEKVLENTYAVVKDEKDVNAFDKSKPVDWRTLFGEWVGPSSDLHECLSAQIVLHDKEIDKALEKIVAKKNERKIMKEKIAKIILGIAYDKKPFGVLLHSELDADRLDWLLRDSAFTGVGYGHIELDYIISRLRVTIDE
jgi:HD superfamily phosphohydrolase